MLEIEKKSIADAGQRREMHSVECDPDAFAPRRKHEKCIFQVLWCKALIRCMCSSGVARQQERARGGEVLAEKTARSVLCNVQGMECGENAQRRYADRGIGRATHAEVPNAIWNCAERRVYRVGQATFGRRRGEPTQQQGG